jgi:hypothetical protein
MTCSEGEAVARGQDLAWSNGPPLHMHPANSDPLIRGRDQDRPIVQDPAGTPWRLVGRLAGERRPGDSDWTPAELGLGRAPRRREGAVVRCADEPNNFAGGCVPLDVPAVRDLPPEVAPLARILRERRDRRGVSRGVGDQSQDEGNPVQDALRRERKTRFGVVNRKGGSVGDRTGIDPHIHPVKSRFVRRAALVNRPAGRVQARVLGERARMQVEGADARSANRMGIQHGQRMDVEQEIGVEGVERIGEGRASKLRCRTDVEFRPGGRCGNDRPPQAVSFDRRDDSRDLGRLGRGEEGLENLGAGRLLGDQDDAQPTVNRTRARSA